MSPFHFMQSLIALIVVLNVLDVMTTSYALRMKIAREKNFIVLDVIHWVGTTWGGLLLVKLPGFLTAAMSLFPQPFAAIGVPTWLLVWLADTPIYAYLIQIAFYAIVVGNNVRICWSHAVKKGNE